MDMLMKGGVKRSNSKQFTSRDPLVVGPIFPIFFPKIPEGFSDAASHSG